MSASSKAVYAAIAADVGIAVAKFVAAGFSGSMSMAAEGVHSLLDGGNGGLLLWGDRASRRPPDDLHPFGYGKEKYFWTLIVALVFFTLGGGITVWEGVQRLLNPEPLESPWWSYAVLVVAAVFQGYTWFVAYRQLRSDRPDGSVLAAAQASKDPETFTVLFQDTAAVIGLAIALLGVFLSHVLGSPYPDGVASVAVGLVLAGVALMLVYESKKLLIGESADADLVESLKGLADGDGAVARVGKALTMHLGPEEVLLNLEVEFREAISAAELSEAVDRLEQAIRGKHPEVKQIFIKAESLGAAAH